MKLPFENLNREILIKKKADSSSKFGCSPSKRPIKELLDRGIVNVDKPAGPTSHQVSAYVKQMLQLTKTGHSGTLDPNVTGVLPVGLGKSTKVVQAILPAGKEYVCIMHLHEEIPKGKIIDTMKSYVGKIKQLPPLKSAVKRQTRTRNIYYIEIIEIDGRDVLFKVGCEAGTYIRKLCFDIGKSLKTNAHMAELRRTKAGPFDETTLATLQELQDAFVFYKEGDEKQIRKCMQPVENAVKHLPKIWVTDYTVNSLCHGAALHIPGISKLNNMEEDDMIALLTLKDELIALATAKMNSKDIMEKEKGVAAVVDAVFMEPGTYPRMIKKN